MTAKEGEEEVPPRVDFALKEKRVGRNTRERNFPLEIHFLILLSSCRNHTLESSHVNSHLSVLTVQGDDSH